MFVCPHLASFSSLSLTCFSFHLFLCLSASLFLLYLYVYGVRMLRARVRLPRRKQKGQASLQGAMINRLGSLAPLERSSLSLSQSLFSKACIRVPIHVPYWAIPLEHWQHLVYFIALCDSIVHDACYIYIYISACVCMGDCALCMMDFCGYMSDPL